MVKIMCNNKEIKIIGSIFKYTFFTNHDNLLMLNGGTPRGGKASPSN
jgi:hypothetical protein